MAHIGQVIVEVNAGCTKIASEECGMGGEDGRHIHLRQLKEEKAHAGEPLVEELATRFL